MKHILLYILAFMLPVLLQAQVKKDFSLKEIEGADSLLRVSNVGIAVYDLTADSLLFAHNEHYTLRPASTMKLTTAVAALDILGKDYKLLTSMKIMPEKGSNTSAKHRKAAITLIGGMDPCFDSTDMKAFIDTLSVLGIDTIYGSILEDKVLKDTMLLGSGWCWDDPNPQLTPLLYNGKDIFLQSFKDSLAAHNIAIVEATCEANEGQPVYATRSHSLSQVLNVALKNSNNLYAEALYYQLSPSNRRSPLFNGRASLANTAREVNQVLDSLVNNGILKDSAVEGEKKWTGRFADGSGLSLYNYQTVDYQINLLSYAYHHPEIFKALYNAMPIAGVDGTLAKRMKGTAAEGNVHAKTGSLTGVSALAGYLTARNGHLICFSIINQGCLSAKAARDFQDRMCVMMCE